MFGFAAMTSMFGENHSLCLATIAQSVGCVAGNAKTLSFDLLHVSVFQSFSTAVMAALALTFLAVVALLWASASDFVTEFRRFSKAPVAERLESKFLRQFIAWVKLQEKRDPAS